MVLTIGCFKLFGKIPSWNDLFIRKVNIGAKKFFDSLIVFAVILSGPVVLFTFKLFNILPNSAIETEFRNIYLLLLAAFTYF